MVYACLAEVKDQIHALAIKALTAEEFQEEFDID